MLLSRWLPAVLVLAPFALAVRMERDAAPEDAPGSVLAGLVRRIQAGDAAAESELVTRFSHGLLLMLRRLVRVSPRSFQATSSRSGRCSSRQRETASR